MDNDSTKLNKYLALHLGISRREADEAIEKGQVTVNGDLAQLGGRVSTGDEVKHRGKLVQDSTQHVLLALNKPTGYVCTRKQQGDNPTVYSLLPAKYHGLKLVGRLDKDSSGIILLTNDGQLSYQMTHPKFHKTKIYEVHLDGELEPLHQQMINDFGVQLEDGVSKIGLSRLSDDNRRDWQITMSEGRNRQIRRTFAALGYQTKKLHRTHFGQYSLDSVDLKPGEYREISIQ